LLREIGWVGFACWAIEEVTGWGVLLLWVLWAVQPSFPEPIWLITPNWIAALMPNWPFLVFAKFFVAQRGVLRSFYPLLQETIHF
jgi:hypothetical protein